MARTPGPKKKERPSTYLVQNREKKEELLRLTIQGRLLTQTMGGPLPEQAEPERFQEVLDVACGPGEWAIDLAQAFPSTSVVGVDISEVMIDSARGQARALAMQEQVLFQVRDALGTLGFPDASFDLVNLRLGVSFIRTWDWPPLIHECLRVIRPGGVLRLTDSVLVPETDSPALKVFAEMGMHALFRAGHLFTLESTGLTGHLTRLLTYHGYQQVQRKTYELAFRAGTPAGEAYYEDLAHLHTLRPFFQKWGFSHDEFDRVYTQALKEVQESQFQATWTLLSAWGSKPKEEQDGVERG